MKKNVVIVARTKMYAGRVCIGALSEDGENIRLMNSSCSHDAGERAPYQVGEQWQVEGDHCGERRRPHLEDFAVTSAKKIGSERKLTEYISKRTALWKGSIDILFGGKIQFTQNGAGYIGELAIPDGATGFWLPSVDLELRNDDRGKGGYYPRGEYRHLSYVGMLDPIERIPAKSLVRVSLARWWRPKDADENLEERCYAQLSGWF